MERKQASDFDPEVLRLYDDYAHGRLDRREYMSRVLFERLSKMSTRAVDENLAPLETPYLRAVGAVQEGLRAVGAAGGYEAPRPPLEYEMQTVGVVESNGGAAHPQVSVAPLCAPSAGWLQPTSFTWCL